MDGNPGDRYPPGGGSEQAKDVTDALETAGIPCCLVGVAALKYFGAGRISEASRGPFSSRLNHCCSLSARTGQSALQQNKLSAASSILQARSTYELCAPLYPYLESLLHTFPLFKLKGYVAWIQLVPSSDCHFECTPQTSSGATKAISTLAWTSSHKAYSTLTV